MLNETIGNLFFNGEPAYPDSSTNEVGIECEMEFRGQDRDYPPPCTGWRYTRDGSLRGRAYEAVLVNPKPRNQVRSVLTTLKNAIEEAGETHKPSNRTSTHVHLNVCNQTVTCVYNIICLYIIFEESLFDYCGKDRKGNLFCLGLNDSNGYTDLIVNCLANYTRNSSELSSYYDGVSSPLTEPAQSALRYSAFNLNALAKFGSIEFRQMRCPLNDNNELDIDTIETWVRLLLAIKDAAIKYKNPIEIIADFSNKGPIDFANHVFKGLTTTILPDIVFAEQLLYDAMYTAQDIAYACDWPTAKEEASRSTVPF